MIIPPTKTTKIAAGHSFGEGALRLRDTQLRAASKRLDMAHLQKLMSKKDTTSTSSRKRVGDQ
jgi:hypothetical protein